MAHGRANTIAGRVMGTIGVLCAIGLAWFGWRLATFDPLAGQRASCADALAFGGARLPEGAYDTDCSVRAWTDTDHEAGFRMPRAAVRDWLRATYPKAPPSAYEDPCRDGSADLCLSLGFTEGDGDWAGRVPGAAGAGFGADSVRVDVTYEGPDRALVRFTAFTT
ncbi:hypothetical protein AB0C59_08665 [Streptomyces sp. NPDC048664]|uniref:hypothetical protein n=1 Tax=Streptomyces sp. NPDC048664 TaxID=3154505 RepID=UPI003422C229